MYRVHASVWLDRHMEKTVFDVLESQFETAFGPDLIAAVESASYGQLRELQERTKAFGQAAEVPPKGDGHLRPYIPLETDDFQRAAHGVYLRPDDFADPRNSELALDALKHHLLYCHSLAIDNPLRWMLDAFVVEPAPYMEDYLERQRAKVLNYLRFLIRIEPLVRAQVVVLVERDIECPYIQDGALSDSASVADIVDFSDLPAEDLALLEGDKALVSHALVIHADHQLACGLDAAATHSGALDLYLPYRHYEDVLRAVVKEKPAEAPEWVREVELKVLSDLLRVSLPGMAELTPREIVAVRQGEEAFARWRSSLERGMGRLGTLDAETLNRDIEELRLIEEELLEGRHSLESEISKSSFLAQAAQGWKEFTIGGVVALGLTPLVGPVPGLMVGAGNIGLKLLLNTFTGRQGRNTARALHHQYLLFSPAQPPLP
jgi:hypothetical protein